MRFPAIRALFYSEFHPVQGPVVVFAVPEHSILTTGSHTHTDDSTTIHFDAISEYVIPKPRLCNRLVSVAATPTRIAVGHPVSIEDARYERNAFLFNLVFVFDTNAAIQPYEQVVRKMARVLRSLEMESNMLSNPDTKHKVLNVMDQLFQDLNQYHECRITINDFEAINLKLFTPPPAPARRVRDWDVPVQLFNLNRLWDRFWDMAICRVIPVLNGCSSVKRVSELSDVEVGLVRMAVEHLMVIGCVALVDVFQFSNVYALNRADFMALLDDSEMQYEFVEFIRKDENDPATPFTAVYALLSAMKQGTTVKKWAETHDVLSKNIDIRRVFVFGVLKGFLRRVHKYPVFCNSGYGSAEPVFGSLSNGVGIGSVDIRRLNRMLDGRHHFDGSCLQLLLFLTNDLPLSA
ncbi:nitrogen permease regulator 2-domain-containing protein [Chytriomyces sp. MP71]|nr:nitrogen permease regulator 2-domain-containing protein [Chytriomyces sp. MP71]